MESDLCPGIFICTCHLNVSKPKLNRFRAACNVEGMVSMDGAAAKTVSSLGMGSSSLQLETVTGLTIGQSNL